MQVAKQVLISKCLVGKGKTPPAQVAEMPTASASIDYLNFATGIGIRPRNPVTMCVVSSGFMSTLFPAIPSANFLAYDRLVVRYLGSISTLSYT